jgi:hypothetical protein
MAPGHRVGLRWYFILLREGYLAGVPRHARIEPLDDDQRQRDTDLRDRKRRRTLLAATNRIFVEFSDANAVVRGSTSVAVQTQ